MADYYVKEQCRLCDSRHLTEVIALESTPPGNHFVSVDDRYLPQPEYPLTVNFCEDCKHLQLGVVVDPKILYQKKYTYVSATSSVFVKHLQDYAIKMMDRFSLSSNDLVVDIGSNDGTTLSFFQKFNCSVLGVDPAIEIVAAANANNIPTVCDFFGFEVAVKCSKEHGHAKLITSHNACAHIDDLQDVVKGVRHWLAKDGVFVLEVGYVLDVYQNKWFDTIYHEHLDFHSVTSLVPFFAGMGMEVFDVERISPQGGSIRVYVQRQGGSRLIENSVSELIQLEKSLRLDEAETFKQFIAKINVVRQELSILLRDLKQKGKSIVGYGAPTKATTLLSFFALGDCLDYIVDDNPLKQGMYTPKHHIPVYGSKIIYDKQPDYVLILAWNFASNIVERHRIYQKNGGRFIIPLPVPEVVE